MIIQPVLFSFDVYLKRYISDSRIEANNCRNAVDEREFCEVQESWGWTAGTRWENILVFTPLSKTDAVLYTKRPQMTPMRASGHIRYSSAGTLR
jgi:hypothetical protein